MTSRALAMHPQPRAVSLLFILAVAGTLRAQSARPVQPTEASYRSGGKAIKVEQYAPATRGKLPVVILLHGTDGMGDAAPVYRLGAAQIADRGMTALLIHYHQRTGTTPAQGEALRPRFEAFLRPDGLTRTERRELLDLYAAWAEAVEGAIKYARGLPNVDGDRVALFGMSMGGFLAIDLGAREDLKVAAVASWFGGLPQEKDRRQAMKKLPPTLVVHGDKDRSVPVKEAEDLCAWLKAKEVEHEAKVYQGVGHGFTTGSKLARTASVADANQRTLRFLEKHLGGRHSTGSKP